MRAEPAGAAMPVPPRRVDAPTRDGAPPGAGGATPPAGSTRPVVVGAPPTRYTPVSGPVLSEMRSTLTPTFSSRVSPRFMNGVCRS